MMAHDHEAVGVEEAEQDTVPLEAVKNTSAKQVVIEQEDETPENGVDLDPADHSLQQEQRAKPAARQDSENLAEDATSSEHFQQSSPAATSELAPEQATTAMDSQTPLPEGTESNQAEVEKYPTGENDNKSIDDGPKIKVMDEPLVSKDETVVKPPGPEKVATADLGQTSQDNSETPDDDAPNVKELTKWLSAKGPIRPRTSSPAVTKAGPIARVVSEHDTANTANVAQLLKQGTFKYQPLQDFLPYDDLKSMRLEDGIDVTRKEDYLSDEDFKSVFKMTKESYATLPAWKRTQAKKSVLLF